jgi:hypothetical protein
MNKIRHFAAGTTLVVFAFFAAASGGKKSDTSGDAGTTATTGGGGAVKASCNQIAFLGTCTEYPKGTTFALAETACGMIPDAGAVWGKDKCPTDKVVGKCVDSAKDALYQDETEYYYAPHFTTESAKKDCVDEAIRKGKTFTPVEFKPKEGEARASCTRKIIGSKNTGPDECEEFPYETSKESFTVIKLNCSGDGDKLEIGKACAKDNAVSKCETKDGSVIYNFPTEAKNAKDHCESAPFNGKYTKLGSAPAAPAAKAAGKPAPKGSAKAK